MRAPRVRQDRGCPAAEPPGTFAFPTEPGPRAGSGGAGRTAPASTAGCRAGVSATSTIMTIRSATRPPSSGSLRWRSRPRGPTCGSAPTPRDTSRRSASTRQDASSTATTTGGTSGEPPRSSAGSRSSRRACRTSACRSPTTCRAGASPASASSRARSGCWTRRRSGSGRTRTRGTTARSDSPRSGGTTSGWVGPARCSTTEAKAAPSARTTSAIPMPCGCSARSMPGAAAAGACSSTRVTTVASCPCAPAT